MSVENYKRLLNVTESLLNKLDLPNTTLGKYQKLKDKLLNNRKTSEVFGSFAGATGSLGAGTSFGRNGGEETMIHLQSDIISMHNRYLSSLVSVFDLFPDVSNHHIDSILSSFFQFFDQQKKSMRSRIVTTGQLLGDVGPVNYLLDTFDDIEDNFERVTGHVSRIRRSIKDKEENEGKIHYRIRQLEDQISSSKNQLENSQGVMVGENRELKENMRILEKENKELQRLIEESLEEQSRLHKKTFEIYSKTQPEFSFRPQKNRRSSSQIRGSLIEKHNKREESIDNDISDTSFYSNIPSHSSLLSSIETALSSLQTDNKRLSEKLESAQSTKILSISTSSTIKSTVSNIEDILNSNHKSFNQISELKKELDQLFKY